MAVTLLDLPDEILLHIFMRCPSTDCATRLSSTNRTLQTAWIKNIDTIVQAIMRRYLPAYDTALCLTKLEASLLNLLNTSRMPARLWLPMLKHNAYLAKSAELCFHKHVATLRPDHYRHFLDTTYFPAPYYLLRRIVLSHKHPELRADIEATLASASDYVIEITWEFARPLVGLDDDEERERHDMIKDPRLLTWEEREFDGTANKDEWEAAMETLWDLMGSRQLRGDHEDIYVKPGVVHESLRSPPIWNV